MPKSDSKIERWRRDIDRIRDDVESLVWLREVYRHLGEIVSSNPAISAPNTLYGFIAHTFSSTTLIGLRRQLDEPRRDGSVSLALLLADINQHAGKLTRTFHLSMYDPARVFGGSVSWNNLAGGEGETYPVCRIVSDRLALAAISARIRPYVDQRLAHLDRKQAIQGPGTYQDLFDGVETLRRIVCRYRLLLTGIDGDLMPPNDDFEWEAIFRVPWIS